LSCKIATKRAAFEFKLNGGEARATIQDGHKETLLTHQPVAARLGSMFTPSTFGLSRYPEYASWQPYLIVEIAVSSGSRPTGVTLGVKAAQKTLTLVSLSHT